MKVSIALISTVALGLVSSMAMALPTAQTAPPSEPGLISKDPQSNAELRSYMKGKLGQPLDSDFASKTPDEKQLIRLPMVKNPAIRALDELKDAANPTYYDYFMKYSEGILFTPFDSCQFTKENWNGSK
ncbi:hypothetical protein BDF22DRAFT_740022 [Syncephalis plumigaleata]|nr:hypothetical protein BDF22DRAFT_740022 [Syncephalis plumigaleata]